MKISYATISECGRRSNNEDALNVVYFPEEHRWMGIVCDGLGGHAMGEVASSVVTGSITQYYEQHRKETDVPKLVRAACKKAALDLQDKACALGNLEMGTTLVMAIIDHGIVTIAHIGDSRCYLLNAVGRLRYLTKDHTRLDFGWEVLDKCFFSTDGQKAVPDIRQFEIGIDCRLLLCSDGLYKSIPPEILLDRMSDDKSPDDILDVMAFLCERNGDDNYSGILAFAEE